MGMVSLVVCLLVCDNNFNKGKKETCLEGTVKHTSVNNHRPTATSLPTTRANLRANNPHKPRLWNQFPKDRPRGISNRKIKTVARRAELQNRAARPITTTITITVTIADTVTIPDDERIRAVPLQTALSDGGVGVLLPGKAQACGAGRVRV
jgi:hypothetical protein